MAFASTLEMVCVSGMIKCFLAKLLSRAESIFFVYKRFFGKYAAGEGKRLIRKI